MRLFTVGHGTLSADAFAALVSEAGIRRIVDVRTAPGSRRHPHFSRSEMSRWLPEAGIAYRWERDLGGWRRPRPGSLHVALRNTAFRGYADHMETPEFSTALDGLLIDAAEDTTAAMCSESLWWRCHRRLLSDTAVLCRGVEVVHLGHDARLSPHAVTSGARPAGATVVYDAGQEPVADWPGTVSE